MFGREPDYAPHDDFLEWQITSGAEVWLQVVGMPAEQAVPHGTRIRFLTDDVRTAAAWARSALGVEPSVVETLPGVVSFTNFADPWGNHLGYYQDLAPSGQQPVLGGSVRDASQFTLDP